MKATATERDCYDVQGCELSFAEIAPGEIEFDSDIRIHVGTGGMEIQTLDGSRKFRLVHGNFTYEFDAPLVKVEDIEISVAQQHLRLSTVTFSVAGKRVKGIPNV